MNCHFTRYTAKFISALIMTVFLCALIPSPGQTEEAPSGEPDPFSPGFSGYLQPMVGVGYSKSLSEVSDKNERIDSLDQGARSETDFVPMLLWAMGYTLDNAATRFYAGTPEQNILEGTFFLELGIQQKLSNGTVLSAAYIPDIPGLDDEVWTDPFLLGANRSETDRDAQAFRIGAESIFGSPFTLRYGFGTEDIDDDQAGVYLSQQPGATLTAQDLQSLKRSGDYHQIEMRYDLPIGEMTALQPGLAYTRGDADGDANSFDRFRAQVSLTRSMGRLFFFSTLSLSRAAYDLRHPVFDETRKDWAYGALVGAGYTAPFGWENFMANCYTGFNRKDSNIGFYDATGAFFGIGLTWMF